MISIKTLTAAIVSLRAQQVARMDLITAINKSGGCSAATKALQSDYDNLTAAEAELENVFTETLRATRAANLQLQAEDPQPTFGDDATFHDGCTVPLPNI